MSSNSWLNPTEAKLCQSLAKLAFCNPFLPERIKLEQEILDEAYQDHGSFWHARTLPLANPNIQHIQAKANQLANRLRKRIDEKGLPPQKILASYHDMITLLLYQQYEPKFQTLLDEKRNGKVIWFRAFQKDYHHFLGPLPQNDALLPPEILFACFFQIRRAFHYIFTCIFGSSLVIAKLRARIWQSIFTFDMRRYRLGLYERMGDITTLVTGPSGTGKELVASCIGHTRYIPFHQETLLFEENYLDAFSAVNLSALSPTLLESELFGHKRGAFTGAIADRTGWLESCPKLGVVFLDEIGELDPGIQVKLLRVLQDRHFQRLGETMPRRFHGKIVAATNRDLAEEIDAFRFRHDLYYRLCADQINTPSLASQLEDHPDELERLVRHIANAIAGSKIGASLTDQAVSWIRDQLPAHYAWPGNFRELEQCVRNILIHGSYQPSHKRAAATDFWEQAKQGNLTADALLQRYCKLVYQKHGSYLAAAKALEVDRRTVKAKVDALHDET